MQNLRPKFFMGKKMSNKEEIFNGVCLALGVTPDIQDADADMGNNAVTIRAAYDLARKTVLRDHPWSFAEKTISLTAIGTPPKDWQYQYLYPADCVKAGEIEKADRRGKPIPFKIRQYEDDDNGKTRVILTDEPDAILIYTRDETDEAIFDPQFTKVLIAYLAYICAKAITTTKNAPTEAWNGYQRAKFEATSSDSNEQIPDDARDAEWIIGRN